MVPPDGAFCDGCRRHVDGVNVDAQWGPFEGNGRAWIGGTGDFFPFVGILTINTPLTNCGHIGVYWTASADASNGYGYEVYVTSDWGRYRQGGDGLRQLGALCEGEVACCLEWEKPDESDSSGSLFVGIRMNAGGRCGAAVSRLCGGTLWASFPRGV